MQPPPLHSWAFCIHSLSTHVFTSPPPQPTGARLIQVALSEVTSGPFPPLLWPEWSIPVVSSFQYSFHPWHPLLAKVPCQSSHFCCWFLGTSRLFSVLCLSEDPPFPLCSPLSVPSPWSCSSTFVFKLQLPKLYFQLYIENYVSDISKAHWNRKLMKSITKLTLYPANLPSLISSPST